MNNLRQRVTIVGDQNAESRAMAAIIGVPSRSTWLSCFRKYAFQATCVVIALCLTNLEIARSAAEFPGSNIMAVSPEKLTAVCSIDFATLLNEKSSLGFVGATDAAFLKAVQQCAFVESVNTHALTFNKKECLAGCADITDTIAERLKTGKNQDSYVPIWDGCATFDAVPLYKAWPDLQKLASAVESSQTQIEQKVAECNRIYEQAKSQGYSEQDLSSLRTRLQGEINSMHARRQSELQQGETRLENTLAYACSMFASQNKLNYVFNDNATFTKFHDITQPLSKYIPTLKSTSSRPLEGPNPYRLGSVNPAACAQFDRNRLLSACETIRKQRQLRAVLSDTAIKCGAQDITNEVLNLMRTTN